MSTEPPPNYGVVSEYEVAVCRWLVRLTAVGGTVCLFAALGTRGDAGQTWFTQRPLTVALAGSWFIGLGLNLGVRAAAWDEYWRQATGWVRVTWPDQLRPDWPRHRRGDILSAVVAMFGMLLVVQALQIGL